MIHRMSSLRDQLFREILLARQRVYQLADPTPLEELPTSLPLTLFLKREDLSPIHAYKWRGAFNKMAQLDRAALDTGVVTASAGNHAQGVALSARRLGTTARLFMPRSTPEMKVAEVQRLGGEAAEIVLTGDTFDQALDAARAEERRSGRAFIHAYDDLQVMGGQGTIADEVVMSGQGPFDTAFVQIGGGGMAAAVSCWLKAYYPDIRIVGVEGVDQASMAAAFAARAPVRLDYLDVFCDGTAVRQVGELTYPLCRELIDELVTVSNEEVSSAVQLLWRSARCVPEPSGAMGVAAAIKMAPELQGQRVLAFLCGANMDFHQLGRIAREANLGSRRLRFLQLEIGEGQGHMLEILNRFPEQINIAEFQYGKSHRTQAWPVIGFEADPAQLDALSATLSTAGIPCRDVTGHQDVEFRVIPFRASLVRNPWFVHLEFYERPGALAQFLGGLGPDASICYFNYTYSGERVGHALIGFEFASAGHRRNFEKNFHQGRGQTYRHFTPIAPEVLKRILTG